MPKRVWLVGGTGDSAAIARRLAVAQIDCTISVTTAAAQNLYRNSPQSQIVVGKLAKVEAIAAFCQAQQIGAIVDASHPYAVEISQKIIAQLPQINIPYLRYERPTVENRGKNTTVLDSFEQLIAGERWQNRRVLLTIGVKNLHRFGLLHDRATFYARILPTPSAIATAVACGWSGDRLIALRPPISLELEIALWQQWQIDLVVTKANGASGGEEIKIQAANRLNIPLIVIRRPRVQYPQQTSILEEIVPFCQKYIY